MRVITFRKCTGVRDVSLLWRAYPFLRVRRHGVPNAEGRGLEGWREPYPFLRQYRGVRNVTAYPFLRPSGSLDGEKAYLFLRDRMAGSGKIGVMSP